MILVLVAIGTLFNFFPVSGGHFAESESWRSLVGSLWTAILIGSILGFFHPIAFSPILLIQVIYKSLWLLVYVAPRLIHGDPNREIYWAIAIIFAVIVVMYPLVIHCKYSKSLRCQMDFIASCQAGQREPRNKGGYNFGF